MPQEILQAPDGHHIALNQWLTDLPAKGVVHWLHGMAEHSARYQPLAQALNEAGWHFYAPDHRGHGASVSDNELRGHFADEGGWEKVLGDIQLIHKSIRERHPNMPLILAGHSMGSFLALSFAEQWGNTLDGLILCGSDYKAPWLWRLARLPIQLERWRKGPRGTSQLISALTFDAFARKIPNRRTAFDWLSRDAEAVDRYIADPWCGHDCTTNLWYDLLSALAVADSPAALEQIPAALPILLIGGDSDPMSGCGKGMPTLYRALQNAKRLNLTFGEFSGGRHEILNDLCSDQVREEIGLWLTERS
ncbi:MAG: alpha/beta hydrolase [Gammaproteobacteria bacterium HGW-Gammaproteobacteria-14]|nr:MAG: alpha/beta hydrolase [Gammaproteobacteria bacterium HGW-Gammaproteobacteria-14]